MDEDQVLEILHRLEDKVDEQGTRLARMEGSLALEATLSHEPRIRVLELYQEGMKVKLSLWGGLAGVIALLATLLREFLAR